MHGIFRVVFNSGGTLIDSTTVAGNCLKIYLLKVGIYTGLEGGNLFSSGRDKKNCIIKVARNAFFFSQIPKG